jgi:cytochrome c oxidase subunit IV
MSAGAEGATARGLFLTWAALMALAALSLGLRFAHLGRVGMVAALGIAVLKAVLVGLVFMELAFEEASIRLAFAAGLFMIAVMLALMIADVMTRAVPPLENPPGTEPSVGSTTSSPDHCRGRCGAAQADHVPEGAEPRVRGAGSSGLRRVIAKARALLASRHGCQANHREEDHEKDRDETGPRTSGSQMVARGDGNERCARSGTGRLSKEQPAADRELPEAVRGSQSSPQGRLVSVGHVDAHLLREPGGEEPERRQASVARRREGRAAGDLRSRPRGDVKASTQ